MDCRLKTPSRERIMVGITTRCSEDSLHWLKDFLIEKFQDLILVVEYLPITNNNRYEWEEKLTKYSAVILYHTKYQGEVTITDMDGGIYRAELSYLCNKLGREKVLVVLDDMKDTSDEEKQRIFKAQPSITQLSSHLILIPETGKHGAASRKIGEFLTILEQTSSCTDDQGQSRTRLTNPKRAEKTQNLYEENSRSLRSKCRVGIFSRSVDDNYKWLVNSLQTDSMRRSLDVRSISISHKHQSYYSEMPECNFAILYHTKNQGRVNITDVTDSLYDRELKELSEFFGRNRVIVVVDDMKDTSDEEKKRILESQPSISALTQDLFLFSERHKNPKTLRSIITLIQKSATQEDTSSLDIYSSHRHHDHSLQSHEFSSKKKQKSSLDNVIDDDNITDKVSWMENQLQALNDSGSVFFARLSEFNDVWRLFQQEKENPQSVIQQLLDKTHTQEEKLKEKDIVISNLRKSLEEKEEEVSHLQRQIKDQKRMIEEKGKSIQELGDMQEGRRHHLEHLEENPEEIIQEMVTIKMQFCDAIQKLEEKYQDQKKLEELQRQKRRGAKKWVSEDAQKEENGSVDESLTSEAETTANYSVPEDMQHLDGRRKTNFLWKRITELESWIKEQTYTTDSQSGELDKYRQMVKELSSQINKYKEELDALHDKTEELRKYDAGDKRN